MQWKCPCFGTPGCTQSEGLHAAASHSEQERAKYIHRSCTYTQACWLRSCQRVVLVGPAWCQRITSLRWSRRANPLLSPHRIFITAERMKNACSWIIYRFRMWANVCAFSIYVHVCVYNVEKSMCEVCVCVFLFFRGHVSTWVRTRNHFSRWKPIMCSSSGADSCTLHKSMLNHRRHAFTLPSRSHFASAALCSLLSAESVRGPRHWHRTQTTDISVWGKVGRGGRGHSTFSSIIDL